MAELVAAADPLWVQLLLQPVWVAAGPAMLLYRPPDLQKNTLNIYLLHFQPRAELGATW